MKDLNQVLILFATVGIAACQDAQLSPSLARLRCDVGSLKAAGSDAVYVLSSERDEERYNRFYIEGCALTERGNATRHVSGTLEDFPREMNGDKANAILTQHDASALLPYTSTRQSDALRRIDVVMDDGRILTLLDSRRQAMIVETIFAGTPSHHESRRFPTDQPRPALVTGFDLGAVPAPE